MSALISCLMHSQFQHGVLWVSRHPASMILTTESAVLCSQHSGGYQAANLGDGNGSINQTGLFRYDFGNTGTGTCIESLDGGNHMRYYGLVLTPLYEEAESRLCDRFWRQNGSSENTGAYFIAASIELNSTLGHDIEPNGYDLGRDAILAVANTSTSLNGVDYKTTVQMVSGLLSSENIHLL